MIYLSLVLVLLLVGPAIATIAILRSLSIRGHLGLLGLCILYGAFPFMVTWGGLRLAERFACTAEAVRFRCPSTSPAWLGDFISGMFLSHWLAIIVIPSAILGTVGLLFSLTLKVRRSQTTNNTSGNISAEPTAAFYRSSHHKVVAGVCSAIAQRWHQPVLAVRTVVVILAVITPGFIFLYVWCWLAFPIEPRSQQQPVR
ncbi:MAG: phage shock protein C (PspC) family protein [Phormidesmis priestleyi Ana]|uniref:Phage shock protein C (PspC) family protein n=1 Tax=Phormidesmis priestleyi Ana TaxID=1666911 RepID=A0A0P7ZI02_9CYAN|nr:MAG: phage shock protein C (PspC) family protein [Phormidesmis priestleyi Ana]